MVARNAVLLTLIRLGFLRADFSREVHLRKSSYLLNDLRNLDEIFEKGVTYDNIKSHKRPVLDPLPRR